MDLLTEEGRLIRDMAERLLGDIPADADAGAHWARIEEAGLPLMLVAQDHGGYGLGVADGAAVIALTGRFAAPLPLAETIVANRLLSDAGLAPAEGPAAFCGGAVALRRDGGGWIAEGVLSAVPWARGSALVAIGRDGDGHRLVALPRPDAADVETGANLAGEPSDTVRVAAPLAPDRVSEAAVEADRLDRAGAAMRCIQMAGAMQAVLDMTVAHVQDRTQFGRALGAFQAVQHQVAVLAGEVAAAAVAGDLATEAWADGGLDGRAIAAAKIRAGEAAGQAARIAHQLHGAIGFTHEYRLHRFVRRLWAWRDSFGGESAWALRLGRGLSAAGGDGLWPALTDI